MICTHGTPLGPLPEAPGCHGSQGRWLGGARAPAASPCAHVRGGAPHPHTPFSHGPFDTTSFTCGLLAPHPASGARPGSAAWVRRPRWGSQGGEARAGLIPGRTLPPASLGGLLSSCALCQPEPGSTCGPGSLWGALGGRHLASWSWIQGPWGGVWGGSGNLGAAEPRPLPWAAHHRGPLLPAQASPGLGAGRCERDRAAAGAWDPLGSAPSPGPACCAHLGGAASSCAESLHTDKRPVPSPGPGPTLGNHRRRFSHGRCPRSGPLLSAHRALGGPALPPTPPGKAGSARSALSAPALPSAGRTSTKGLSVHLLCPAGPATLA